MTWSPADLLTVLNATNAALAINSAGAIGLLYQQLTGTGAARRWVTHFRQSADGANWADLVLCTAPASTPAKTFDPYLGDYDHLVAVRRDFYGSSANNTPDQANFPNGVVYQRNADCRAPPAGARWHHGGGLIDRPVLLQGEGIRYRSIEGGVAMDEVFPVLAGVIVGLVIPTVVSSSSVRWIVLVALSVVLGGWRAGSAASWPSARPTC